MLKIALRNVLRNKRRTLLCLAIIIFGTIFLFLASGYMQDTYKGLKWMEISSNGHFQVASTGFWDVNDGQRRLLVSEEIKK